MKGHRVTLGDLIDEVQGSPLRLHVVLAQDFEPGDVGVVLEDVCIVHSPEAEPEAKVGEREAIHCG